MKSNEFILEADDPLAKANEYIKTIYSRGSANPIGSGVIFAPKSTTSDEDALVKVELAPHRNSNVHVSEVIVLDRPGGLGYGSAVLKFLTSTADAQGIELTLFAKPIEVRGQKKIPASKLKSFYKKHGFKLSRGNRMVREPVAQ